MDLTVLFLVDGTADITADNEQFRLEKEDIMLLNAGAKYRINCSGQAILAKAGYPLQVLSEVLEDDSILPMWNSKIDSGKNLFLHRQVKEIFFQLIYDDVRHIRKSTCIRQSLLFRLMDLLIEEYFLPEQAKGIIEVQDERLQKMLRYVIRHYQDNIGLADLADQMYVSASTLSRLFKKGTGIQFTDYVNQVRMRYATWDLAHTDHNIARIATDSGYGNLPTFNRVFKELYGMSPSEYRVVQVEKIRKEEAEEKLRSKELRERLEEQFGPRTEERTQKAEVEVTADVMQGKRYEKSWNKLLNGGSAYGMTLANLQYHIGYLKENLGFQYLRMWNIFSTKLMPADGIYIKRYNFDKIDSVMDFTVSNHLKPFLDLGRRPDTAILKEGKTIFFNEEYIEFKSRAMWEDVVENLIVHFVKRYGREEVDQWIFEISRDVVHEEIHPIYKDADYDYREVYRFVYQTVKKYAPNAQVGGPAAIMPANGNFLEDYLQYGKEHACVPDFLSFLLFPYDAYKDGEEIKYQRTGEPGWEAKIVDMMRDLLRENGVEDCRLYAVEFNNTLSNRNYLNDSCSRAAYLADQMGKIWDKADMTGIWMATDWVSNYYDTPQIVNGGSGILTKDSIRKPAYFACQFLNKLGSTLVAKGENYIITKKERNSYYILCFNHKQYSSGYYLKEENFASPDELADCFEDTDSMEMQICLKNMPSDVTYIIKRRYINQNEGAILGQWKKFQYSTELTHSDVKYIRDACIPGMGMEKKEAVNGTLRFRLTLESHEITLVHIYEDIN